MDFNRDEMLNVSEVNGFRPAHEERLRSDSVRPGRIDAFGTGAIEALDPAFPDRNQDAIVKNMVAEIEALIRDDRHVPMLPRADGDLGKLSSAIGELTHLLEARFAQLHRLMQLTEQINTGLVIDEVLEQLFVSFRDVIPYDRIGVALLDTDGAKISARWSRSLAATVKLPVGFSAPIRGSSLQQVFTTGQPRILNDLQTYLAEHPDSHSTRLIVAEGVRSSLTCPLSAMGRRVGFMFFSSFRKDTYRSAHADLFLAIAGQLSMIIEKGRIYEMVLQSKKESDRLLLNVLPASIATRLKAGELQIADWHLETTLVFADIVGFTAMASNAPADKVVGILNRVFSAFDAICEYHGVEKIKTIGDAYMFASGVPTRRDDHLEAAVQAALDMQEIVQHALTREGIGIQVRIGIATGPVIAGVIGTTKFSYDVWGDTVNLASRMESHGVAGRIQVTAGVQEKLRDRVDFEARGPIDIKGKGSTACFLIKSCRSPLRSSAVPYAVSTMGTRRTCLEPLASFASDDICVERRSRPAELPPLLAGTDLSH
jgi:class 3 adenylate cyclase